MTTIGIAMNTVSFLLAVGTLMATINIKNENKQKQ